MTPHEFILPHDGGSGAVDERSAPSASAPDTARLRPSTTRSSSEQSCARRYARRLAAVFAGSDAVRRRLHGTQRTCWVDCDGSAVTLRTLPGDPACDGACMEACFEALERLLQRFGEDLTDQRCRGLASNEVDSVLRRWDGDRGLYVRLDRLDPDRPGTFVATETSRAPVAPAWYRDALRDHASRRRAHRLLWFARSADVAYDCVFPIERWADEDGLTVREEQQLVASIVQRLSDARPDFVEANIERPLAAKRWFGVPTGQDAISTSCDLVADAALDALTVEDRRTATSLAGGDEGDVSDIRLDRAFEGLRPWTDAA